MIRPAVITQSATIARTDMAVEQTGVAPGKPGHSDLDTAEVKVFAAHIALEEIERFNNIRNSDAAKTGRNVLKA